MATLFRAAAAAIVKNEAPYIAEWIEYHTLLGIEHFFIFDNNSEDDLGAVLRPYLVAGRATLLTWPGYPEQMSAYNYAIRMFGHSCDWLTLLDIDEFIHLAVPGTLPDYWDGLGDIDQVLMPWIIFGAGGHDGKPAGLVIENYVYRTEAPAAAAKCAVRPAAVRSAEVHHCVTHGGRTVDGDGRAVVEAWQLHQPRASAARVHHYITKSRSEWVAKVSRGQADGTIWRREDEFASYQGDVFDDSLRCRAAQVRTMLARSTNDAGPGYVSLARSKLSEVTPSRRWTRRAMYRLRQGAGQLDGAEPWHLAMQVDDASINRSSRADGRVERAAGAMFGLLAADLGAHALSPTSLGRPFLCYWADGASPIDLLSIVRGTDASGQRYEHRRRTPIKPGTTLGALILSPRTMIVQALELEIPGAGHGDRLEHQAFGFL